MTNITEIVEEIIGALGRLKTHSEWLGSGYSPEVQRKLQREILTHFFTTLEATHQQELEEAYQRSYADAFKPNKTKWYALERYTREVLDEDESLVDLVQRMRERGVEPVYSKGVYKALEDDTTGV